MCMPSCATLRDRKEIKNPDSQLQTNGQEDNTSSCSFYGLSEGKQIPGEPEGAIASNHDL